jgi:hypothetical protein
MQRQKRRVSAEDLHSDGHIPFGYVCYDFHDLTGNTPHQLIHPSIMKQRYIDAIFLIWSGSSKKLCCFNAAAVHNQVFKSCIVLVSRVKVQCSFTKHVCEPYVFCLLYFDVLFLHPIVDWYHRCNGISDASIADVLISIL